MPRARATSFIFLAILAASCSAQSAPASAKLFLSEAGTTISIHFQPLSNANPDSFRNLDFRSGDHTYRITSRYELSYMAANIDGTGGIVPGDPIRGLAIDRARFFFTGHYTLESKLHTLLFFIGIEGLNGVPLLVVGFHDDGSPYKVLELKQFNMLAFHHPDGGTPAIIGKQSLSEVMSSDGDYDPYKPYATTYDPFSLYLIHPNAPAEYSLAESKFYNQKHYTWAGPNSREEYAVVYNLPRHPRPFGVPASQLNSIFK